MSGWKARRTLCPARSAARLRRALPERDDYVAEAGLYLHAHISTLHRLLDMAPGNAPERLCARNSCMGLDLLSLAEVAPVVSAFALGRLCGPFGVLVALVPLIPLLWLCEQFRLFERRGRARCRRGECPWCGRKRGVEPAACPCRDPCAQAGG